MALLLPIFALLLVITVDFGRAFFTYIQITNAAREGAAYAATVPADTAGITARAQQERNVQSQGGENAMTVAVTCVDSAGSPITCASSPGGAGAGNRITVAISEPFSFFTPLVNGFLGSGFALSADATANVLGYAAGGGGSGGPTGPAPCTTPPTASFTVTVLTGRTVSTDPSGSSPNSGICNISGYNWSWGDGTDAVGSASSQEHTYSLDGTYTIILQVTNGAGTAQTTGTVTVPAGGPVSCDPPVANFTWSESANKKEHTYTDASTVTDPVNCFITNWLWTFGDGSQSNAQNPAAVNYGNAGKNDHDVTLTVTNPGGSDTITIRH
ncbi:MAG: pilus assembly protein [Chloroflexi bacterium]|nr:pilus assembly protein [Chloroflexota bacterium]